MDLLKDIFDWIVKFLLKILQPFIQKFLDINLFEKLNVLSFVVAFFAIVLPVGKFQIFDSYSIINNPLAVYMIGIVLIMTVTIYFPNKISFIGRELVNVYYLFWVVFMQLSGSISKAPYELTPGYYVNLVVPVLFMVFSVLSYFNYGER